MRRSFIMRLAVALLASILVACAAPDPGPGDVGPVDAGRHDAGRACTQPSDCDDGLFCNGPEICTASRCAAGVGPCTSAMCDEAHDTCVVSCPVPDADHDGVDSMPCGGTDCDDSDASRFPGNTEICNAGHDEDCDPTTFGMLDLDADGYVSATCCDGPLCGLDCDDLVASTHPTANETCNDVDDDCDLAVDEGLTLQTYARDCDGDGFGEIGGVTVSRCAAPLPVAGCTGFATMATDCDDTAAAANPANGESCDNVDNDCDGTVDEGIGGMSLQMPCYTDADEDGLAPAGAAMTGVCVDVCPRFTTNVAPVDAARTDCDDTVASVAALVAGRQDLDADRVGGADATQCPTDANFIPAATGTRDCDDHNADIFPGQTGYFTTPTGRGCLDATYNIVCGNGTCGRLNGTCCPPMTLPTCFTADVRPDQPLWNYDCDPRPSAPPHSDGCTSCGACSGGYVYTDTSQCGQAASSVACVNTCALVGIHFCNPMMSTATTLPCR